MVRHCINHINHSGKLIHELKTFKEDMEIYQESRPLLSLSSDDGFWSGSESNMGLHWNGCGRWHCLGVKEGGSEQDKLFSTRGILAGLWPEVLPRAGATVAGLSGPLPNTTFHKRWLSLVAASQTTSNSPSTSLRNTKRERERGKGLF